LVDIRRLDELPVGFDCIKLRREVSSELEERNRFVRPNYAAEAAAARPEEETATSYKIMEE
jgi:hypothetical protein